MEFLFVLLFQAAAGEPAEPPATDPAQQTEQVPAVADQAQSTAAPAEEPRPRIRCTRRAPTNSRLERRVCDTEENIEARNRRAEEGTRELQRLRTGTPGGN